MTGVMLAIFMVATDSYIVATAMPTIVADLGGFRLFSWAFAAFLLAQAVTIPIYGRLADLYGRKRCLIFVCIVLIGPAALATFRRAARRASFRAPVSFQPEVPA